MLFSFLIIFHIRGFVVGIYLLNLEKLLEFVNTQWLSSGIISLKITCYEKAVTWISVLSVLYVRSECCKG